MTDPDDQFERDLEAVMGRRAGSFSSELRQMLEDLWRQGVLEGRARERQHQPLELEKAQLSECGDWLCVPLPIGLRVLGATRSPTRLERLARARPRAQLDRTPYQQLLAEIDGQVLEELKRQSRERPLPGQFVVLAHVPAPRPPKLRERANTFDPAPTAPTSQRYGGLPIPFTQMWTKTYNVSSLLSQQTSTKGGSSNSGDGTQGPGSSSKP